MVNNGVMFVTTPQNQVLVLDAASGELNWRHQPKFRGICSRSIRPTEVWRSGVTRGANRERNESIEVLDTYFNTL